MENYSHKCIKCAAVYTDTDPEPYYCKPCNEQKKIIAAEVDKKLASRPRKETKSELQMFDEARRGGRFAHSKLLGI